MYAIRDKKSGKYVSGTDYRQHYINHNVKLGTYKQISDGSALTYPDYWSAQHDFLNRGCSPTVYKIVEVEVVEVDK